MDLKRVFVDGDHGPIEMVSDEDLAFLREPSPEAYEVPILDPGPVTYIDGQAAYVAPVIDRSRMPGK